MSKRTLVTSALPYANGPIHLGHLAGAYLPADLYTRYKRLRGEEILHICGSDEHGVPITIAAEREGVQPQDIVDRFHERNKQAFQVFGIDFDYYGRTSSTVHKETSQAFFTRLDKKGVFRRKTEQQLYDPEAGMFLPDRYVKGTCPICGYEDAHGDQCEKCGSSLSPTDLMDPKSTLTGKTPETRETEHWYLPLGAYQPKIEAWINSRTNWKPNVTGQCKSWLSDGLSDRAVTRDLSWGVPVPHPDADQKVLYVWFDAPIGYISATREWAQSIGDEEAWKTWWQDSDTRLIHFIGKDNIVFHCIMFPLMLMEHGEFILPDQVPANEFLNLEGKKLSTSRGWAVWLDEAMEQFEPDLLRFVLGSTLPETKDSDFSWADFQTRVNSELADILGNFVYRSTTFTERFHEGRVPELNNPSKRDLAALEAIQIAAREIAEAYEEFKFREAITRTMKLARIGNKYFTESEPWKTRKSDPEACANTLHVSLQICGALSVLFSPVLPAKMNQLRSDLGLDHSTLWDHVSEAMLTPGSTISSGTVLFEKIEDESIEFQLQKLQGHAAQDKENETSEEFKLPELKPVASFDNFDALDLRVGKILKAQDMEGSKKLLKLTVDIGLEVRTILSGVKEHFEPMQLEGKLVGVVANLAPKKMMGVESNGMILMSESSDGSLRLLSPDGDPGDPIC
ncbi:MAG: methionine--tRNA ligase [Balneolaceae bacterium]